MGLSSRCLLGMLSQSSGTVACGWDGYVIRSLVGSFPRFFDEICTEGFDRKEAFGDCGSKAEIVRLRGPNSGEDKNKISRKTT